MSMVSIEDLIRPVAAETPCGEDVSELTEYYVLEDLVAGATQDEGAEAGTEAQWPKVLDTAVELLQRGKELRVALHLVHALLRLDGIPGLRDGLRLLERLVVDFWEGLYPALDADEDNPAMARMNLLRDLSAGATGRASMSAGGLSGESAFVAALRGTRLCGSRAAGSFSWRDVQMATGEIRAPEGKPVLALSQIEGSIRETDPAEMARLSQALEESIASIAAVDHLLTEKLAANNTSQIANLGTLLGLILARLREAQSTAAAPVALAAAAAGAPTGVASSLRAPATGFGTITTQSDVVKALDAICAWYEANEKSSPVPYFLKRAKRLVGQDFMSIVKDVARNAEDQVKELFGTRDEGG